MEIKVDRKYKKSKYTIGNLYINGEWFSNTLEDKDRGLKSTMTLDEIKKIKIKGETAIPSGTYNIIITYSPKFKKPMPLLLGVKGFEGIRIHSGNDNSHTEGCLLLGENRVVGKVINSRYTFNRFFNILKEAFDKGETITITIK